ncbi:DUF4190 domain-containing protein [Streptomyces sp. NPDC057386]|uniref:DUF4190 domain-containing protein n=1 Tax=unclassified Streptomyces TaxID=2593676 RepID=UPI003645A6A2
MAIPPPPGPQQPPSTPGPQGPYDGPYPQGPYGPPYQPWGQGYSPFNRPAPVNGLAIASLVLGLLCFVPAVGLVLGVIALVQIRKKGERGKGMAIAGSVLSAVGLALWTLMLATGGAADFWEGFKEGARGGADAELTVGRCVDLPGGLVERDVYDVDEVPCSGRHDGEVFHTFRMTGSSFPGESAVDKAAEDGCSAHVDEYVMDSWAMTEEVDVYYIGPTDDTWDFGDRVVACLLGNTEEGKKLTGSLRTDATTLDGDQLAFLKAGNALDAVLATEPDTYPEDDLKANQDWAGKVRDSLATQVTALRGHGWAAGARNAVDSYAKDLEAARSEWAKAASAADADTFYIHYDKGWEYLESDTAVDARRALDLATTRPDSIAPGGGTGDSGSAGDGLDV